MQTFPLILTLVGGILGLYLGAELLVRFASKLALSLGMTHLMTGLTIVALCTSSPELASSLMAQIQGGYSDIALGNVIGTNISNTALIIGVLALIRPLSIHKNVWKIEAPLVLFTTALLWFLMIFGRISRFMGVLFCALLILYLIRHIWMDHPKEKEEKTVIPFWTKSLYIVGILLGTFILALGGYLLIKGAVDIGHKSGVSDRILGLTIVAIGTSLPEFAASCVALLKRMSDVALGNMFGSNVYNILMVLGIVSLVHPIEFSPKLLYQDMPLLMAASLLIWIFIFQKQVLTRLKGALLVLFYAGYLFWVFQGP